MLQMQLSEMEQERREIEERLLDREQQESAQAEPVIQRTLQEVEVLQREVDLCQARKSDLLAQIEDGLVGDKSVPTGVENGIVIFQAGCHVVGTEQSDPCRLLERFSPHQSNVRP